MRGLNCFSIKFLCGNIKRRERLIVTGQGVEEDRRRIKLMMPEI
jgi:hypothetical protein